MTELEAIRARHSVRQYLNKPLKPDELAALRAEVDACNQESGLHIQLVTNEPKAFEGTMARYGKFSGVQNYFALVGKAGPDLQEKCGYWGERLVLKAQMMGLNTCWVALTFTKVKSAYTLNDGEKLAAVIALGHGANQGFPRKSKTMDEVVKADGPHARLVQGRDGGRPAGTHGGKSAEVPVHAGGRQSVCPAGPRVLCENGFGNRQISL